MPIPPNSGDFVSRVQEIFTSSIPNSIWEVGTAAKVLRGHLSGLGPDYLEMQVPVAGATPLIVIRLADVIYVARGSTDYP